MKFNKKILAAVLVLALAMSMVAAMAAEIVAGSNVKFTGSAYAYKGDGSRKTKQSIIVKKGSTSFVHDVKGDWALVCLCPVGEHLKSPFDLWFNKKYLKPVKSDDYKIVYAAGGSGRSEEYDRAPIVGLKGKKIKATGKCNIRKTASLQGKSLGVFRKGETMKLTGNMGIDTRGVIWYGVKFSWKNGKTDVKEAWVSSEYTELV